ncbi:MAG: hypothetical protein CVU89_00125 [Firmicutes bacterium HGW-Firmicutes-14]|nr:MAG: hypothetical protein CVU89_00125 [Firmicutes bacterium HGW-Firmicutes-14]
MDFKDLILNRLLDKYENSIHYRGQAKVNRKIAISFNAKSFPWYWDSERPYLKKAVHQVIADLAGRGIISYKWMAFEKGNLLDCAWLNLENIDSAYSSIGRTPKKDKAKEAAKEIEDLLFKVTLEWVKNFLEDCLAELRDKSDFPAMLPAEKEDMELLFRAFLGLEDKKDNVLLERVFSIKYLGHSKVFQREVKTRLARIANRYLINEQTLHHQEMTEDEIIAELGIERNSEEVLIWGAVSFLYGEKEIDYSVFPFGGVIDTRYLAGMKISSVKAKKIITIENKANFHYLVSRRPADGILLVYLGGFPGPRKRSFLAHLYRLNPDIPFYHWGDIDLGGFRIFSALRKTIPGLEPLFMDEVTLLKYRDYCDELEENYIKQLEKLLDKKEYDNFRPVIRLMLQEKIRLEQEALLAEDEVAAECFFPDMYVI